jgi:predicted DNA repair protein MutK
MVLVDIPVEAAVFIVSRIDDDARLALFAKDISVAILACSVELDDTHQRKQKNKAEALFRLLMERLFFATRAIFHFLHLVRMGTFIAGGDVVLLSADRAFKRHIVAFAFCHNFSHFFLFAGSILT